MWNSLLSPLSRGQGKQNGALKVVDKSEEYSVPSFLPSLVPPEKTVWHLPSRLARDDGEVVLPRTYLTRRGPLLLFTTPDMLMAEQQGEQHRPRASRHRLKGTEPGVTLGTVDGLIESVLQFGLEEAADEPKGKTFLRFLKGLDERSIDMRAQPGGDLGVYLRHLKSSAGRPKFSRESDSSQYYSDNSRTLSGDFGPKGHSRSYSSGVGMNNKLSSGQLLASLQSAGSYLGRPFSTAQAQDFASRTSNYADDESDSEGYLLTKGHRSHHHDHGFKVGGEGSKVKGMVRKKTHRLPDSQSFSRQISGQFYEHDDAIQSDDSSSSSGLTSSKSTFRNKKSTKKSRASPSSAKSRSFPGHLERLDSDVRDNTESPQSPTIAPPPPSVMESSGQEDPGNELEHHGIGTKIHAEMSQESEQDDISRLKDTQSRSTSTTSSRRQRRSRGLASGNGSDVGNKSPRKERIDTGYETAEQPDTTGRLLRQQEQNEDDQIDGPTRRILDNRQSSFHSSDVDSIFQVASRPESRNNVQQNDVADTEEESEERFRQNVESLRPLLPQYTVDSLARKTSFTLQSSLPDENTEVVLEPVEVAMLPHAPREVARSRSVSQSTIRTIRSFLSGEADDDDSTDGNDLETGGGFTDRTNILERNTDDQVDGPVTNTPGPEGVQYATRTLEVAADPTKAPAVSGTQQVQTSSVSIKDIDPDEKAAILAKLGYGTPTTSSKDSFEKEEESKQSPDHKPSVTERESLPQNTTEDSTNMQQQETKVKKGPISIPSAPSGEDTASAEKPAAAARRRLNSTERAALMAKLGMADDVSAEKDADVKEGEPQKSPGRKATQVPKPGSKPGSRKAARQKQPPKKKNGKKKDSDAKTPENAKPAVVGSLDIAGVEGERGDREEWLAEDPEDVQNDMAEERVEGEEKGDKKAEKESKKKRAQELKKEQEELKQKMQEDKKRREEEQRMLKERIREREEAKRREDEERRRQIEEQQTAVEMAEMDAEEAARMEEESKRLLAESRKKAREEREARRKADQERRREEAQRRRDEQKQMQLEAQEREERMRRAIGDAEERRRLAEIERKRREEEERRLEEEQRAEEERMRREAEEEEERIRAAERSAEEEEMRKLARERREAEERKRLAKEEAERKRREDVKKKFLQELKEQEEAEKRRQAELAELQRLEEERQRRLELEQLDAERREQARLEAELAREEEARRQEHNLNMRKNLAFVRHGQEFTKPWVWSYFKNVPMEVLREPYVKEDPKKNWKPKPKPKNPAPEV
ncbi:PREDICTED: titin homolog [Branchiostoma belcheri]|uniref:Titin homolog n=1 Tax=Branchiostoma belcheri TaxID=7741 RepID=A0A6P4ZUR7_BRABE|nr:PREDICTED: titin homolog [Branchiostoma belcheri]